MLHKIITLILFISLSFVTIAREGMWIPTLLDRNIEEMQQMGFQLSVEDIYSVNHASMKDAIVLFGHGCTGELISPDGLLVTNHHCGYGQIQAHSSLEHDYLTDGFWAKNRTEELPNEDLSVTFLVKMRDVTKQVLFGTDTLISKKTIAELKRENMAIIKDEAIDGTHYKATIKPFFEGNQYFLFITEEFTDVRLVGAPPSAIGKFGGDTDNWMWPRHTGDFSMFRVYADSTNQPANYSPNNVPYHPKKYFSINISGINEGDFTMIFGYPGSTHQYLHSDAINQTINQQDPDRIAIRNIKLDIMHKAMETAPSTRIKYSTKYAHTSNSWKKWQGEIKGLKRLDAIKVKEKQEKEFSNWVNATSQRKNDYGTVLNEFEKHYHEIAPYQKAKDYYDEIVIRGTDAYQMYRSIVTTINSNDSINIETLYSSIDKHFKDYEKEVDRAVFVALINKYHNDIRSIYLPEHFNKLFNKKNTDKYFSTIYRSSPLNNPELLKNIYAKEDLRKIKKAIQKDPLFKLFQSFITHYSDSVAPSYYKIKKQIDQNQKIYMTAILEQKKGKLLFPDANLTMRVTYGKVEGYQPADGIEYKHYTTLEGIIEKDNPEIYDYNVPQKLKELYKQKAYGPYANAQGQLPICFSASNHTTGGNSGSPVINAQGELIGINFDRCWEGTMSDLMFDGEKCRNISLDMRYMLFLIDKFAGAHYLIDEMQIVK